MNRKMGIFEDGNYKFISKLVENKLPVLRQNTEFNQKYVRLSDAMEELEATLTEEQKEHFNEIVQLFYQTEEYYFAFAYSLGLKYGEDLEKL